MQYKLPVSYDGLGEHSQYGATDDPSIGTFAALTGKSQIGRKFISRKRQVKEKARIKGAFGSKMITPKMMAALKKSSVPSASAQKAFPWREEHGKVLEAASSTEVSAAVAEIEAQQLQQAEDLKGQGRMDEAASIVAGSALDAASQKVEADRMQLQADRDTRDAQIAADNKRNQLIGYGMAALLTGGALFLILKK